MPEDTRTPDNNPAHRPDMPAAVNSPGDGTDRPVAVVTGASSGIGAATARRLAAEGFHVVLGARRTDRIEALAAELGGSAFPLDVTDQLSVDDFCARVPACRVLVNNAGGAFGMDPVAEAEVADWQAMYEVNVLGVVRMTKALLPALIASGAGDVLLVGSTAGMIAYEGGGGYSAAKHGTHVVAETLRLELAGQPVRVMVIAPGMVATEEFSKNRFEGDQARADAVYAGVREPLVAEDMADAIGWMLTRPHHVNVDLLVVRPLAQAAQHKVVREDSGST